MRAFTAAALAALLLPAAAPSAEPCGAPDLSGRWSGYWVSDKNGHRGPLRANFRKVSDACYRVTFTGRFWKVVPFVYSVNLAVTGASTDAVTLAGETRAGPVIGTFRYDATATACDFEARFTSKNDSGRFVLSRR
jgi:hypothetical protein